MDVVNEPAGVGLVDTDTKGLSGRMGVLELIFTVVAYNGPLVVFLGFLPAMILLGNGIGTPVAVLASGSVIMMVAVGLLKMNNRLDKPGGFYALITAGLGRVPGLAAGLTALVCYFAALISVYALGGLALNSIVTGLLQGPEISWKVWALLILAAATVLGHFNISLSARVLTVLLFAELVLIALYDGWILTTGGARGLSFESFTPDQITSGSLSIALLFGIGIFGGFEATVIFRDEVKNPLRTVPVASYGVIALLGGMYALTAWCYINAFGAGEVMGVLTNDLAGASTSSIQQYMGTVAADTATVMLFTSSFALVLAAHSITARYLFNLGADRIFPHKLGEAHPRHVSPHRASVAVSAAALLVLIVFFFVDVSSSDIYARLAGLYAYAFLILVVLVSLAIGVFLLRDRANGNAVGPAVLSLIACGIVLVTLGFATQNFTVLTGATGTVKAVLLVIIWGTTVTGAVMALVLRRSRPQIYARIGRQ